MAQIYSCTNVWNIWNLTMLVTTEQWKWSGADSCRLESRFGYFLTYFTTVFFYLKSCQDSSWLGTEVPRPSQDGQALQGLSLLPTLQRVAPNLPSVPQFQPHCCLSSEIFPTRKFLHLLFPPRKMSFHFQFKFLWISDQCLKTDFLMAFPALRCSMALFDAYAH